MIPARFRNVSRRDVIAGMVGIAGAAMFEAGRIAVDKLVIDPLLDAPQRDPFVSTPLPWSTFATYAAPRQKAAFRAWRDGVDVAAALPGLDPEAKHAVIEFGDRARYTRVGRGLTVLDPTIVEGQPVMVSPDPSYGRFVYGRAAECVQSRVPAFTSCFGRMPGLPEPVRYLSLMLPSGRAVSSVGYPSSEWPTAARPASARRDEGQRSRGNDATI